MRVKWFRLVLQLTACFIVLCICLLWNSYHYPPPFEQRYMISYCKDVCGGWAERLNRFAFTYIISSLTNRKFGIKFDDMPCALTDFLQPNKVNWDIIEGTDLKSGAMVYDFKKSWKLHEPISLIDFGDVFTSRVAYFKSDPDFFDEIRVNERYRRQLKWMNPLTYDQIFVHIFKELFKLSPKVQASLDSTLQHSAKRPFERGKLVCAHLRFANNTELLPYIVQRHTAEHGETVLSFLQSLDPTSTRYNATTAKKAFTSLSASSAVINSFFLRFFLTSDSAEYINKAANTFGQRFVRTPGQFVHIGVQPRGETNQVLCDGLSKVIEDQQLLTHCDVLVIGKSSLARQAAYLRGTDAGLYCMLPSGRLVKCLRSGLRALYGIVG